MAEQNFKAQAFWPSAHICFHNLTNLNTSYVNSRFRTFIDMTLSGPPFFFLSEKADTGQSLASYEMPDMKCEPILMGSFTKSSQQLCLVVIFPPII